MTLYNDLFEQEGQEISKLGHTVDSEQINALVDLINNCNGNIILTGCGTSAMDAKKAVHTLSVIGTRAFYLNPSDAVHGSLGVIRKNDLVIFVSKGGSTKELTNFLPNIKIKKAKIVAITENPDSVIGKAAYLVVKVRVDREIDKFNMLATTSSLAVISLFDVVAVSLMRKDNFSQKQFLNNHPSGDVGKRLSAEVK